MAEWSNIRKEWRGSVILAYMLWNEGGTQLAMTHKNLLIEIQRTGIHIMQQGIIVRVKAKLNYRKFVLEATSAVVKHGINFGG